MRGKVTNPAAGTGMDAAPDAKNELGKRDVDQVTGQEVTPPPKCLQLPAKEPTQHFDISDEKEGENKDPKEIKVPDA